ARAPPAARTSAHVLESSGRRVDRGARGLAPALDRRSGAGRALTSPSRRSIVNRHRGVPFVCVVYGLAGLAMGGGALAQAPPAPPPSRWTDSAEFSYVATAGNAESTTLGFKNTLGRKWASSSIELKAGGVRASSTTTTRTAVATGPSTFFVIE